MDANSIGKEIVDAAIAVHRALGLGLLETVYEVVLLDEIWKLAYGNASDTVTKRHADEMAVWAGLVLLYPGRIVHVFVVLPVVSNAESLFFAGVSDIMLLNTLVYLLTFLEVLAALLLIGIILIQQSKAGGGLGAMGGGVTETVFGATAGNVLTRGTVILASIFLVVTLLLAVITGQRRVGKSIADELGAETEAVEMPAVGDAEAEADADSGAIDSEGGDETPADATKESDSSDSSGKEKGGEATPDAGTAAKKETAPAD